MWDGFSTRPTLGARTRGPRATFAYTAAGPMERRFVVFVAASAAFMTALLLVDRDGLPQQLALGMATAAFLWLFVRGSEIAARQVVCCILVATAGEIVL